MQPYVFKIIVADRVREYGRVFLLNRCSLMRSGTGPLGIFPSISELLELGSGLSLKSGPLD